MLSDPPPVSSMPAELSSTPTPSSPHLLTQVPPPPHVSAPPLLLYRLPTDTTGAPLPLSPALKRVSRVSGGSVLLLPAWLAKIVAAHIDKVITGSDAATTVSNSSKPPTRTTSAKSPVPSDPVFDVLAVPPAELAATLAPLAAGVLPPVLDHDEPLSLINMPKPSLPLSTALSLSSKLHGALIHADDHVLCLNKPPGLNIHESDKAVRGPAAGAPEHCLSALLSASHALSGHYQRFALWLRLVLAHARVPAHTAGCCASLPATATEQALQALIGESSTRKQPLLPLLPLEYQPPAAPLAQAPAHASSHVIGLQPAAAALLASLPGCPYSRAELRALAALAQDRWHREHLAAEDIRHTQPHTQAPSAPAPAAVPPQILRPGLSVLLGSSAPRLVHRLDRDAAGALLVARSRRAAAALGDAFRRNTEDGVEASVAKRADADAAAVLPPTLHKCYWALTAASPALGPAASRWEPQQAPSHPLHAEVADVPALQGAAAALGAGGDCLGVIDFPIPAKASLHIASANPAAPVTAVSTFRRALTARGLTLWQLAPVTGRQHQLRVHCADKRGLGAAILGDPWYGDGNGEVGVGGKAKLQLLCRLLCVKHPVFSESEEDQYSLLERARVALDWGGPQAVEKLLKDELDGLITVRAAPPPHMAELLENMGSKMPHTIIKQIQ